MYLTKSLTKFSGKGLNLSKNHCYFRGEIYQENKTVDNNLAYAVCEVECSCKTNGNRYVTLHNLSFFNTSLIL